MSSTFIEKTCSHLDGVFGCGNPPDSLAWKFYNKVAGSVTCICCTFFRGIFIGLGLSSITALIIWGIVSLF